MYIWLITNKIYLYYTRVPATANVTKYISLSTINWVSMFQKGLLRSPNAIIRISNALLESFNINTAPYYYGPITAFKAKNPYRPA